jgi:hypothetical protein
MQCSEATLMCIRNICVTKKRKRDEFEFDSASRTAAKWLKETGKSTVPQCAILVLPNGKFQCRIVYERSCFHIGDFSSEHWARVHFQIETDEMLRSMKAARLKRARFARLLEKIVALKRTEEKTKQVTLVSKSDKEHRSSSKGSSSKEQHKKQKLK